MERALITAPKIARLLGRSRLWANRQVEGGRYGPIVCRRGRWAYVNVATVESVENRSFTHEQLVTAGVRQPAAYQREFGEAVYVIEHPSGFVKIGQSRWVQGRFATLDGASPIPLRLAYVHAVLDATDAERRVHKRLGARRARPDMQRNEWFKIETERAIEIVKTECSTINAKLEDQRRADVMAQLLACGPQENP